MINFIKNFAKLREKIFFTKKDLFDLGIKEDVVLELLKEGALRDLTHGIFTLSEKDVFLDTQAIFLLPKILNKKSYLTGETVFDIERVIFGFFNGCIIASDKNEILDLDDTYIHLYKQSTIKPETRELEIILNNNGIGITKNVLKIEIATLEQALVDYFFNQADICSDDFDEFHNLVRLQLARKVDLEKLKEISHKTNDEKTIKSIYFLIEWVSGAKKKI